MTGPLQLNSRDRARLERQDQERRLRSLEETVALQRDQIVTLTLIVQRLTGTVPVPPRGSL